MPPKSKAKLKYRVRQWNDLHEPPKEGEYVIYSDLSNQILHLRCEEHEARDFAFMLNHAAMMRESMENGF